MRQIAKIVLLISILAMIVRCDEKLKPCVDCGGISFVENYLENIRRNDVFFIKGKALDVHKYGRNIQVIEDLKGNFGNKSSVFVWGMEMGTGRPCTTEPHKVDVITHYNTNDTLIMIVEHARKRFSGDLEKRGDYTTMACAFSVLKLSNDSVTGVINSEWLETMLWSELREELLKQLQNRTSTSR